MGFSSTTTDTKTAPSKIASCAQKTASREIFSSNRRFTYKIERNPLKTQQEESNYTYKIASGRGTWPSRDPIEEKGGINLYAFVGNRPTMFWDYLGLDILGLDPDGGFAEALLHDILFLGGVALDAVRNIEEDDFGRKCCGDEMENIKLLYHPTIIQGFSLVDAGHASLVTPNIPAAGLWPLNGASLTEPTDPGYLNTDVADEGLDDHTHQIVYEACPDSVKAVEDRIRDVQQSIANGVNPFGGAPGEEYNFLNLAGSMSCIGFVCDTITHAGGTAPANPMPLNPTIPANLPGAVPIP